MKKLFILVALLVIFSSVNVLAATCENATMKIHFTSYQNQGNGNFVPYTYVGNKLKFSDSQIIPLSSNGTSIIDSRFLQNVPGLSVQRQDGKLRFIQYGSKSSSDKEIVSAEISLENAVFTKFTNDNSYSPYRPYSSNKLERPQDGIYKLGSTSQDELFLYNQSALLFSTVSTENDGFYLNYQCIPTNTNQTNQTNTTLKITKKMYIVPYFGDIDGTVSPSWHYFYNNISQFYKTNNIPASISVFPELMTNDSDFKNAIIGMYQNPNIEIIQKAGGTDEQHMNNLTYEQQKAIVKGGQDAFRTNMANYLSVPEASVKVPTAYDLILGRFTNTTMAVCKELGFKQYFDLYYSDDVGPVNPTPDFDVIQYGVSFTTDGKTGKETTFKTNQQIYDELNNFTRKDLVVKTINGAPVIPLWAHQQDFESTTQPAAINMAKYNQYTQIITALKNDPNVVIITAEQAYDMTHGNTNQTNTTGETLCQYASSATATSENEGSNAIFATGAPDAPIAGCAVGQWSGYSYSWNPLLWNTKSNLTLNYNSPVNVNNVTVFGDYDMCWNSMWLENSKTGEKRQIFNGVNTDCTFTQTASGDFLADRVTIETCGWGWTSTDAVQVCGQGNATPTPTPQSNVEICTWKDCKKGAASVIIDDYFTSCSDKLERNNFRGTYALTHTDTYTEEQWAEFNTLFNKGHEIATHTQQHWCVGQSESAYKADIEANINDIITHTDAKRTDLITQVHPCGYTDDVVAKVLNEEGYLNARGYNFNQLEDASPKNFFILKSINSHGYPGGTLEPPNYFTLIDDTEREGKWANLVFHVECSDDGVIDYLPTKSIWVDTEGNVVKYIKLRDSAKITNYAETSREINFKITSATDANLAGQSLTIKIPIKSGFVSKVEVDNVQVNYKWLQDSNGSYVQLDIQPPINHNVKITIG